MRKIKLAAVGIAAALGVTLLASPATASTPYVTNSQCTFDPVLGAGYRTADYAKWDLVSGQTRRVWYVGMRMNGPAGAHVNMYWFLKTDTGQTVRSGSVANVPTNTLRNWPTDYTYSPSLRMQYSYEVRNAAGTYLGTGYYAVVLHTGVFPLAQHMTSCAAQVNPL